MRNAVWLLTVVFALGGIAEAGPAVLCVGEDGHVDVEYGLSDCCVLVPNDSAQRESQTTVADLSGCDDCVDLGISLNSLKTGKNLLPAPAVTVLRISPMRTETTGGAAPDTARHVDHEMLTTALSSIVLLV